VKLSLQQLISNPKKKELQCGKKKVTLIVKRSIEALLQEAIHRAKKDGDWHIYPQFLAHKNQKNAPKNAKKRCKNLKLSIHNVASTGTNLCKKHGF